MCAVLVVSHFAAHVLGPWESYNEDVAHWYVMYYIITTIKLFYFCLKYLHFFSNQTATLLNTPKINY